MDSDLTQSRLIGVLECPMRNAFIEFEYSLGDQVGDLRERINQLWGVPDEMGYDIFMGLQAWAILCKDSSGTYSPLNDDDSLPPKTPDPIGEMDRHFAEFQQWSSQRRRRLPKGLLYTHHGRASGRIKINMVRGYDLPKSDYNIYLISLALITGG